MPPARRGRIVTASTSVAAVLAATAAGFGVAPSAGAAPADDTSARQKVIVVLKDQLAGAPADRAHALARAGLAVRSQDAVLGRLAGPSARSLIHYTTGNAFAANLTGNQVSALGSDPAVASVTADRKVAVTPPTAQQAASAPVAAAAGTATVDPSACSSDPAHPVLEPEALQTIKARSSDPAAKTAAALGIDGSGVKVAFIADGINPANAGFRRTDGTSSIVDYKDFYGDGPDAVTSGAEAFGDASAVSAQGNVVYDVADFANPKVVDFPGGHCYIKIVGVAPGADVVALKAGSELLPNSAILQAIDYAVATAKVDVINESFGSNTYPDDGTRDTVALFNDQAVAAGVTVTVSSGDAGITGTVGNPSTDPNVISTGASTDSRIYEQTGYALSTAFGNGHWLDSNISALGSAGITQAGRTVDLSAPGEADWAVCDSSGNFVGCLSFGNPAHPLADIQSFGGTSQSAPFTAGAAALVIQAYRSTHGGTSPAPATVKAILTSTASDLGLPGEDQGAGLLDTRAAVEAALTYPGATSAAPAGVASNVALSTSQLHVEGAPGSTQSGSFTVTNVGTETQTVDASVDRFAPQSSATQSLRIDAGGGPTTPYPTTALPWVYKKVTFTVPAGADRLATTIRWQSGASFGETGPVVRLSLFDPSGAFASNTRPQGGGFPANYGLATVREPAAGTWTAVLYTPARTGFTGTVSLTSATQRAVHVGSITPATSTLAAGASTTVQVSVPTPAVGGDTGYVARIASSGGHETAVPVIARTLVPTGSGAGRFAGTITGGNARSYAPAQTFSYAFDVPAGKKDVEVGLTLARDPGDLIEGILIDPDGEAASINSNVRTNAGQRRTLQNTVANPTAGRWRYVVLVENPVTGKELSQDFTGTVTFDRIQVRTSVPVPSTLKAGKPVSLSVRVTNRGNAALLLEADARLAGQQRLALVPQFTPDGTIDLPLDVEELSDLPAFLVPPGTSKLEVTADSSTPAQVELSSPAGGIDVFGDLAAARAGSTTSTATVAETTPTVGTGYWFPYVQQIGPFSAPAPSGTSTLTGYATTAPFDPAVTSSTGDDFLAAVDAAAPLGKPLSVYPGETRNIKVTITPTAAVGSTVTGVLNLVTPVIGAGSLNTTGEVVATVPYSYTVN